MISYDRVFAEMERQLKVAQNTANEREMREALAAIRSLCEVALGGRVEKSEKVIPKMLETPQIAQVQSLTSLEVKPMKEEGANGESLFDF